jgi:ubiquinone/menaquinone biosynthesis C-methylase UbiE
MAGLRQRAFAWVYHTFNSGHGEDDSPLTRDVRLPLLSRAGGAILEIGAGTGANLRYFPPDSPLTLLEPNPFMVRYLRETVSSMQRRDIIILEAPAESIPLPDASMDTVVSTHVLCSVRDQSGALSKIRRVLKPGGVFLFMEHVAAHPDSGWHRAQQVINPAWRFVGDGCHLTRDTGAAIRAGGFSAVQIEDFHAPDFPAIVSPHISGTATA